jgi:predicted permease
MHTLAQDVRYAIRKLGRARGFTLVAVASLALGIGANTTIFSLVNALLLRPVQVPHAEQLVTVHATDRNGGGFHSFSYLDYADYRDRNHTFAGLAATSFAASTVGSGDDAALVAGLAVSGNYFDVLQVRPLLGRTFRPEEDRTPGAAPVVVLGHSMWQTRFGGDPTIVGKAIIINAQPFTVIGVMRPGFSSHYVGPRVDFWAPLMMTEVLKRAGRLLDSRGDTWLEFVGRLRPDASRDEALADLNTIAGQLDTQYPAESREQVRRVTVLPARPLFPQARTPVAAFMALLMGVVGLVLLAACTNLANLLLARAVARRREIGVRLALGASRGRLVRQLLTESVLLSVTGGLLGIVLALWMRDALLAFQPPIPVPLAFELPLDWRVLTFTLVLSLGTGILFGLAPALRSTRADVVGAIKDDDAGRAFRKSRLRGTLVAAQIGVSLVLLVGSGLFVRSLQNARNIDVGFETRDMLLATVDPAQQGYTGARRREFFRELLARLAAQPGVRAASAAATVPLGLDNAETSVRIEAATGPQRVAGGAAFNVIAPDYFRTMGMTLLRGRDFAIKDDETAPDVVVINETLAERAWPGQDPIGKRVSTSGDTGPWREVIGVVRTAKYRQLGEAPKPFVYFPYFQGMGEELTLHVRTAGDPMALLPVVRREVQALDRNIPLADVKTMTQHMKISLLPAQLAGTLLGAFGLVALLLAAIGVYGVMSYAASQRTREIGIRMALGATARDVVRLIVSQGMTPVIGGLTVGAALAFGLGRLVGSLLYGISPADPPTFVGVAFLLGAVAVLASWVPARRAAKVDPMVALRHE